ncbi:hypothetical protein JTE90_021941 [Oedothorax gibbosus]|uniref:tRNA (34-2'-O)-methyltransferase regulator WDR6 n=1 Tax=Oedothorax gibbosus TaxID=931172 RepID=A0AAV6VXM7_9ARAC|nr:hypothetical protein JTE90_021941 [Oedothorax gibbosus]
MNIEENESIKSIQRAQLCTHITALKTYQNFLLVAESNQVLLFDWNERILLQKEIVFESCSIHGIRIDNNGKTIFFGAKSLRIFVLTSSSKKLEEKSKELHLNDWIHDIQWITADQQLQSSFAVISAHNCLTIWDWECKKSSVFQCAENCILYAASIIISDASTIIVAAGTVFNKILLWSPQSSKEMNNRKIPFQSLSGHQGVIFSVIYNRTKQLLSSTSDDRSVRLWKVCGNSESADNSLSFWENSKIELAHVLFAHESRVWMSAILPNGILSVGEDSNLCYWDLQGNLLKKRKCHKNGSIWCLEVTETSLNAKNSSDEVSYMAFTGGSDGGVYMWDVSNTFSSTVITQISLPEKDSYHNDFPRITCLLTNFRCDNIAVTTDKGKLSMYDINLKTWKDIFSDTSFASYCVPSISSKSKYLALGNIHGELVLINLKDQNFTQEKVKIYDSKICSIHWVNQSSDYLLTCGLKGHMILWKVTFGDDKFHLAYVTTLNLPKCKHHWWSTAALCINSNCCIVGDRGGSISVYSNLEISASMSESNQLDPSMVYRGMHGDNGVTDIQERNNLVYSTGRDGKVQLYVFSQNTVLLLHTIKVSHDLEWIGRLLFHGEDLLLLGFHTKHFMVWSTKLESAVMTVECGGGHRSWDFSLNERAEATFAAIKKKDVIFCQENLHHVLNKSVLKAGICGQEFCHTTYLFTKNFDSESYMSVVACGGEDNGLRIIGLHNTIGQNPQIVSISTLSGHLSSIRAIGKVKVPAENAYLFVSVGGRSQMMIWKIKDTGGIHCEQLGSFILSDLDKAVKKLSKKDQHIQIDPQTRLMDVAICHWEAEKGNSSKKYVISTACSDSYFRIYLFDEATKELALHYNFHHGEHCILKLHQIVINHPVDDILFVTGATDGLVKMFSYQTCISNSIKEMHNYISAQKIEPDLNMKQHQSGVNALDVKCIEGSSWLICSAGDDNALAVALINIIFIKEKLEINVASKYHIPNAHASQIVGVKILDNSFLVTTSIDQRINVWKWSLTENLLKVEHRISKMSLIPDIAHLNAWQNKITENWTLLVCGQGIECFDFNF